MIREKVEENRLDAVAACQERMAKVVDSICYAAYKPSVYELSLSTLDNSSVPPVEMLKMERKSDGIYHILSGPKINGSDSLNLAELMAMKGGKIGQLFVHGKTRAAEALRALQNTTEKVPELAFDEIVRLENGLFDGTLDLKVGSEQLVMEIRKPKSPDNVAQKDLVNHASPRRTM